MTKKEIVKAISEKFNKELTQVQTKKIVQSTLDAIVEALVEEGRIELRNFGVFEVKKRAARKARNPRTGDKVQVEEKFVVTFKPGKEMEDKVLHYKPSDKESDEEGTSVEDAHPAKPPFNHLASNENNESNNGGPGSFPQSGESHPSTKSGDLG